MAKKSFTGGLNSLLGETPAQVEKVVKEQPTEKSEEIKPTYEVLKPITKEVKTQPKMVPKNSSKAGTKENETRATFIVNDELLEKLKGISYWDRVSIKDLVNAALLDVVTKYERKNGDVKLVPKSR